MSCGPKKSHRQPRHGERGEDLRPIYHEVITHLNSHFQPWLGPEGQLPQRSPGGCGRHKCTQAELIMQSEDPAEHCPDLHVHTS
jgi:hypothetical protein